MMKLLDNNHWAITLCASAIAFSLSACSSKPPGCADAEVISAMQDIVFGSGSQDPQVQAMLSGAKLELTEVVSEGYQADAQKQMCRAKLSLALPAGESFQRAVEYSTQKTVDGKGTFLLTVEDAQPIQLVARVSIARALKNQRWAGPWNGEFSCSASARPTDANPAAFVEPVSATIKNGAIEIALAGRDGVKRLGGHIDEESQSFTLRSDGPMSDRNDVVVSMRGKVENGALVASGEALDIFTGMSGLRLRSCELRLGKDASQQASASSRKTAFSWVGTFYGEGEGDVTLKVEAARSDGAHPVTLTTSTARTGGGCGGHIEGLGRVQGDELKIHASSNGSTCEATASLDGQQVHVEQGADCYRFHGAACSFSASLQRTK